MLRILLCHCSATLAAVLLLASGVPVLASGPTEGAAAVRAPLPPLPEWSGESRDLIAGEGDPWITPAEKSGLVRTPSYDETTAFLRRMVAAAPELSLTSIGKSAQGRDIWMVIADAEGASTPEALAARDVPVALFHAGIHSGEIDGKDAGLMLLRDMLLGEKPKAELLEGASVLFIPILNPDGHERSSPFSRMNQRGPEEMGWRTNSRNLNLNRDFTKLDPREVRALVETLRRWNPHLYVDLHVTDGADYLYDVTYGFNGSHAAGSPSGARWLERRLRPAVDEALRERGHVPGPLVFLADNADPGKGNVVWTAPPRFSNGYGDLIHLPTVLVENHSLKPYDQRVLGTYLFLEEALAVLGRHGAELRAAIESDRALRPEVLPLAWAVGGGDGGRAGAFLGAAQSEGENDRSKEEARPATMEFLGIASKRVPSEISGGERLVYTGEPVRMEIPALVMNRVAVSARRPRAYWLAPGWDEVVERLEIHGIRLERPAEARTERVERIYLDSPEVQPMAFEGRVLVKAEPRAETLAETFSPGWIRVPTDQPLGDLAIALLEPEGPDSFFQWGFFLSVLQRTEYGEAYVLEPLAEAMLEADPELRAEFEAALEADPELAMDPRARLGWFYRRTPYWDDQYLLYPVRREMGVRREVEQRRD